MGELGQESKTLQLGDNIKGLENKAADMLSRPDEAKGYRSDQQSLLDHLDATLAAFPRFANYKVFMPSKSVLDAIAWALRPTDVVEDTAISPPTIVQVYGRFISVDEFRVSMEFLYD